MNLHSFTRAALALLILFVFHYSIIVEALGENGSSENKTISKKSRYHYTSNESYSRKQTTLYKENKNKHLFTKISSQAGSWKLHQVSKVSVTRSTTVSQEKTPEATYENNKMVKQSSSAKSMTKKSKTTTHRNRMIETSKDSYSSEPSKTTSTHHVPMGSAIKSFFSDKPKPTTTVTSSKSSDSHYIIKDAEKTTDTSKAKHTATTTHDKFPFLHSLFPTGHTKKPTKTHHQDLGGVIESKISSFFHPPKKTDDGESSKTHHFHIPRPSFLDPLFSHHDHGKTSTSDKETTSTKTKTHTKYNTDSLSSTDSTMAAKSTTPMTPTTTSITLETSTSTVSSTTLPTTTSEISQTISYTTRSFSITSSTATPSLVLGVFNCARDPHTVNGKCDSEYFCNSATHQCVALANIGGSCYEDFQCGSTYCENNKCVLYPGYQPGAASMSGGQIAGATVGSVAGATVVLLGLLGWRRRAQSVNRRIEQLKKSNDDVGFYTDYGIAPVDPTRNTTRESKYDFLNQMLKTQPTTLDKPGSPTDMSSIQDPWKAEDQEMNHKRRYTFF